MRKVPDVKCRKRSGTRKRRSIVLIVTEGKNKTETLYFSHFKSNDKYVLKFVKGNYTDPANIYRTLQTEMIEKELKAELGDKAYLVVDADMLADAKKEAALEMMLTKANETFQPVVSNPCFEVWYLAHFINRMSAYADNKKVLNRLKVFIPKYTKNLDVF